MHARAGWCTWFRYVVGSVGWEATKLTVVKKSGRWWWVGCGHTPLEPWEPGAWELEDAVTRSRTCLLTRALFCSCPCESPRRRPGGKRLPIIVIRIPKQLKT